MVEARCAEELAEFLAGNGERVTVRGTDSGRHFRTQLPPERPSISFRGVGCIEISPADQIAVVAAGTEIAILQAELGKHGQAIPLAGYSGLSHTATLGGSVSLNLPHPLEGLCGSWRDWILGMTVILANGEIVKCGSKAVKNVAGYDLHKLFIGARGTLGVISEVVLRTYPLARFRDLSPSGENISVPDRIWIQRLLNTDFMAALGAINTNLLLKDELTSTLWASGAKAGHRRFAGDWVLQTGVAPEVAGAEERRLMLGLKNKLDPDSKLNAGEFGFL